MPLGKKRQLKLLILVLQNQNSLFRQKKLLLVLKILLTKRTILFNILAMLFDEYVVFTYAETMLKNVGFLYRNQGW